MSVAAVARVSGQNAYPLRSRDGAHEESRRSVRDWLDLAAKAPAPLKLVVGGVEVGEEMPVKVKRHGITVRGTAVVNKMSALGSEFEIHIRDRVFGRKVEKDVSVAVEKKPEGGYTFTKEEDGKVEHADVAQFRVEGKMTRLTVPDSKKGRMTEIQFTDLGNGRFKIRGEDFTADFNA